MRITALLFLLTAFLVACDESPGGTPPDAMIPDVIRVDLDDLDAAAADLAAPDGVTPDMVEPPDQSTHDAPAPIKGVWVVGQGGTILHKAQGGAWGAQKSNTANSLYGVWGSSSNDIWAVGFKGTVLRYHGVSWQPVASGTSDGLSAVWGSGPDDVWLGGTAWVGNKAVSLILHWNGKTLSKADTSGIQSKYQMGVIALWGCGKDNVWGVTTSALLVHWDGKSWTHDPAWPGGSIAGGVWCSGPKEVWLSTSAAVHHFDGAAWSSKTVINDMRAIWGAGPKDIWLGGGMGGLCHYNGSWDCNKAKFSKNVGSYFERILGRSSTDIYALQTIGNSHVAHYDGALWTVEALGAKYVHDLWVTP